MTKNYEPRLFKFSGAGNDFVVLDGRQRGMEPFREPVRIGQLCREYHTDGLMILTQPSAVHSGPSAVHSAPSSCHSERSEESPYHFVMEFYNPDGSGGMMCGNGGRCIVAFANYLGIHPADGAPYRFLAPDGEHTAEILSEKIPGQARNDGSVMADSDRPSLPTWTVRLKMIDVKGVTPMKDGYFLNTGTRHFVQFVPEVDSKDMEAEAKPLRWDAAFQPEGTNVNFVEVRADGLHVRTFEKGVEGETLACGTGLTACALAAYKAGVSSSDGAERPRGSGGLGPQNVEDKTTLQAIYRLQCRRGDWLQVDFRPGPEDRFTDVYLTGPAELVAINPL